MDDRGNYNLFMFHSCDMRIPYENRYFIDDKQYLVYVCVCWSSARMYIHDSVADNPEYICLILKIQIEDGEKQKITGTFCKLKII